MKGKIHVNDIDLYYVEQGSGAAIVLIHGNLVDYRFWLPYLKPLAQSYRVVTYSRRYNYPNQNHGFLPRYSAMVDAEDLVELIQALDLAPAHLIGHAYGALAALTLACEQPALVRSLVVAEPPLLKWLERLPEGLTLSAEYEEVLWQPVRQAFEQDDMAAALRLTMDYLAGARALERMSVEYRQMLGQNLGEWRAIALADDAFPLLPTDRVKQINVPFLSITGDNSPRWLQLISTELEQLVTHSERIIIPHVGHEMWEAAPERCRKIVLEFLGNLNRFILSGRSQE